MRLPPPAACRRIRLLYAMTQSPNANEAAVAQRKLAALLYEWGLSEADVPHILAATDDKGEEKTGPSINRQTHDGPMVNVFDLNAALTEDHVTLTRHERIAVALWITHTYVFQQFRITPRLAILSPVNGCGKTALLDLLELTTAKPFRSDDVSPATIYHERDDNPGATFLIDEADNLNLFGDERMREVDTKSPPY